MTRKRKKNIEERYLNNLGIPTAVVIPCSLYYSVKLPEGMGDMDVKSYNYKNNRVLYSEMPVDGWDISDGVVVVPYGLRLYQHDLEDYILFDGMLDEDALMDMLNKIYCGEKCKKYKIHIVTDEWKSEIS
ncbi:MAG: hypothetical protein GQ477_03095 [Nanohaloarchaea archaeon]|nr:hypothetical protein [Candidatus Nanohaloarchaea archaeon]